MNDDLIGRQAAINLISQHTFYNDYDDTDMCSLVDGLRKLPSAQPETCEGCKHLGKWENEVEYGYPSPCTRCKRRVEDYYER